MICFDVSLNGTRLCRAGIGERGVMTAITSFTRRDESTPDGSPNDGEIECSVGGLVTEDGTYSHRRWVEKKLVVGDELALAVVESDKPDAPDSIQREEAEWREQREYEYYLRLKEKYEPNAT